MKYKIIRTDKANEQLREIVFYIADDSGNMDIALNYLDKMEAAIKRLEDFPCLGVFRNIQSCENKVIGCS